MGSRSCKPMPKIRMRNKQKVHSISFTIRIGQRYMLSHNRAFPYPLLVHHQKQGIRGRKMTTNPLLLTQVWESWSENDHESLTRNKTGDSWSENNHESLTLPKARDSWTKNNHESLTRNKQGIRGQKMTTNPLPEKKQGNRGRKMTTNPLLLRKARDSWSKNNHESLTS
jgi:hypothetical protein